MIAYAERRFVRHVTNSAGKIISEDFVDMRCKSTDEKPTEGIADGSTCLETDTRKVFFFDGEAKQWI